MESFKFLLFSVFYYALIGLVLCINSSHFISKFFNLKFLQYTGKISYGLYVYHTLLLFLISCYFSTEILIIDFIVLMALSYTVSNISFRYIESFLLKFKRDLSFNKI
jgi:peptidoglycan/LPS O-acetylase OafA/YrhL